MSQQSNKEQEEKKVGEKPQEPDSDTDIVMTHGAADDDEDDNKVEAVNASIADAKGASNAAKLNNTLRKME